LLNRVSVLGVLVFFSLALSLSFAKADRLKDMTSIAGVRSNQLVGYGLVVGLAEVAMECCSHTASNAVNDQPICVVTSAANMNVKCSVSHCYC